ncbi:hypothetical protein IGJ78_002431 [Enterococcus sp. DIV2447a]|uniref:WxL domain-containing protein n=1 Tax=unclassified Enterococcus TaxID=2608891 RepID=UPI003D300D18
MKKRMLATAFAATAILGASVAPAAVHANTTGTSPAQIEFREGTLPGGGGGDNGTDGPGDGNNDGDNEGGSLTSFDLLYVPRAFNFAATQIGSDLTAGIAIDPSIEAEQTATPPLTGTNTLVKRFGVGDVRGTNEGWHVTANVAEMKNGSDALVGEIQFKQTGAYAKYNGTSYEREVAGFDTDLAAPTFAGTSIPVGGDAVTIANADKGQGQGTWDSELSDIKLSIQTPASQIKAGTYTGKINWTLVSGPSA